MRAPLLLLAAAALLPALAACGGNVVVDAAATSTGGAGGTLGTGGSSIDAGPPPPPACDPFPAPVGALFDCGGGAAGSGAGMPFACSTHRCDNLKNQYLADCVGTACQCTYIPSDGTATLGCSCTLDSSCEVNGHDCCPVHQ
jgi:hypothetical protein